MSFFASFYCACLGLNPLLALLTKEGDIILLILGLFIMKFQCFFIFSKWQINKQSLLKLPSGKHPIGGQPKQGKSLYRGKAHYRLCSVN